jgi:hypothetical protein
MALSGGIVLEEAVDLSVDRLLMNELMKRSCTYQKEKHLDMMSRNDIKQQTFDP